jgi:hypothetical protein
VPSLGDEANREYMLGLTRARLYRAAAQIAFAIEDVDWTAFAGMQGVDYRLETNAGLILVRDGGPTTWEEQGDILLQIDLGGDDDYLDEVASNTSAANPVSLAIDLGGLDTYHYESVETPWDQVGLLPADADGRYMGNGQYGNYTLSNRFRQGAARNGIAMLFDFGGGDDHYQSLRGSQGYAHMGVGVLFDDGGDDVYEGEAAVQGSAQYGIGLAVDAGAGIDARRAFTFAQGFGWVGGAGVLVDGGGDDTYSCDIGDPNQGGLPVYYSPQLPQLGNTSFCQGAGYGLRNDSSSTQSQAGGIGILHDVVATMLMTRRCSLRALGIGRERESCPTPEVRTATTRPGMSRAASLITRSGCTSISATTTMNSISCATASASTRVVATTSRSGC